MAITVTPLTSCFAARIVGADITRPLDEGTWSQIRAAFDEHSVLVFGGPALDDEQQIAFSRRFGALEVTRSMNPAAGTPFARQSNLDIKTGEVIPADDRRMVYQLANMLWHSDSSFKPVPSLCSLLSARILPPEGGATEFASARCAYPSLPEALKRRAESAVVVHDFAWSRDQVRPGFFTERERAEYPPVRHPLVRVNPVNGRKTLFLGAHASHIVGLPRGGGPRAPEGAAGPRDPARVLLSPRVAGGRARRVGQPVRPPPRDAVRYRALQAAHAADHDIGRSRARTARPEPRPRLAPGSRVARARSCGARQGGDDARRQSPCLPHWLRHAPGLSQRGAAAHPPRLQRGVPAAAPDTGAARGGGPDPRRRGPARPAPRPEPPRLPADERGDGGVTPRHERGVRPLLRRAARRGRGSRRVQGADGRRRLHLRRPAPLRGGRHTTPRMPRRGARGRCRSRRSSGCGGIRAG